MINWNKFYRTNRVILFVIAVIFSSMTSRPLFKIGLTISGPTCVRSGIEYQYVIAGSLDSVTSMQICLTGGVFADNGQTCMDDTLLAEVRVIWTDTISGSLTLNSETSNISKNVTLTKELQPGLIDSAVTIQVIKSDSTAATIICGQASGGACQPDYVYQWQQSADNIEWADINGENNQHFEFSSVSSQSTFYRRKVTEMNSSTIAYSAVAAVFVEPANE